MNKYLSYLESLPRKLFFAVLLLLLGVVGTIDYLTNVEISLSAFYLLPVAVGAWFLGRRTGVFISIISAIVWYLADVMSSLSYSHPIVPYWNTLVMFGIFLPTALVLSTLKQTIDRDNNLAKEIQKQLLPKEMPRIPGYEIAGAWQPAQSVSGDYYDVIRVDDGSVVLCVGDVVGHGIPAALLMSNMQAAVRMLVLGRLVPRDICAQLNALIMRNTPPGIFITFFFCVLDIRKKEIVYTNAGHPRPVIIRGNGEKIFLDTGGLPVGVLPDSCYSQGISSFEEGDLMLIYTDGVMEASDSENELFGESRILESLMENHKRGASAACNGILKAVSEFGKGTYKDDLALLAISAHATDVV